MAQIGWIDFSPEHRKKVGSVLDLLGEEGVVDELGIGTMRNAIANRLFPGVSTIQTRARYFFFIPYILRELQDRGSVKDNLRYLKDAENELMWDLAEAYQHREGEGVIGISKRKPQELARRPSAIYWNGISHYRFIDARGMDMVSFIKRGSNKGEETLLALLENGDDGSSDDKDVDYQNRFRIKVPRHPGWRHPVTLNLTHNEADFFRDRIREFAPDSLFWHVLENEETRRAFNESDDFRGFSSKKPFKSMPEQIRKDVIFAHDLSELLYGAHIFYNGMVQENQFGKNPFQEEWDIWRDALKHSMHDFKGFDPTRISQYGRSKNGFAYQWWEFAKSGFSDEKRIAKCICEQERMSKKSKARLAYHKYKDVKEGRWIGLTYLDYRFRNAKTLVHDIVNGLRE